MSQLSIRNENQKFIISKDEEEIFSFEAEVEEDNNYEHIFVHLMKSKDTDYAIYNTSFDSFPKQYFVNLKTKEVKLLCENCKGVIYNIANNEDFFIFTNYLCGQISLIYIYNFNCEKIGTDMFNIDSKYDEIISSLEDEIDIIDGKLTFQFVIPAEFIDNYSDMINFDTSVLTYKEYDNTSKKRKAIVPFLTYPQKEELISFDELLKIEEFTNKIYGQKKI